MMVLIALVNIQLLLTTVLLLIGLYSVQSSEIRIEVGTSNEMKKTDRSYMPICRYVCNRTNVH